MQNLAPDLLPFVHASYSSPSSLFWSDKIIQSAEGVQQGDPLGPLLFCLTIHPLVSQLKLELCVWYLDDSTIGGPAEDIKHDLEVIVCEGAALGLHLNERKSEVIGDDLAARDSILLSIPEDRRSIRNLLFCWAPPLVIRGLLLMLFLGRHSYSAQWEIDSNMFRPMMHCYSFAILSPSHSCCTSLGPHPVSYPPASKCMMMF